MLLLVSRTAASVASSRRTGGVGGLGAARQRGDIVGQRLGRALGRVEAAEHHRIGDRRARRGLRALEPGERARRSRPAPCRLPSLPWDRRWRAPAGPRDRSIAFRSRRAAGSGSAADLAAAPRTRRTARTAAATSKPPAAAGKRRRRHAAATANRRQPGEPRAGGRRRRLGFRAAAVRRLGGGSGGSAAAAGGCSLGRAVPARRASARNFGRRQVDHGRRPAPARACGPGRTFFVRHAAILDDSIG